MSSANMLSSVLLFMCLARQSCGVRAQPKSRQQMLLDTEMRGSLWICCIFSIGTVQDLPELWDRLPWNEFSMELLNNACLQVFLEITLTVARTAANFTVSWVVCLTTITYLGRVMSPPSTLANSVSPRWPNAPKVKLTILAVFNANHSQNHEYTSFGQ